ncbi:MAG: hypothetical protein NTW50_04895 [Candidatus Berkelbacteria bacterium]|nr:hypothetical protein [Candidatus Berkelbacteria bacterium]
MKNLSADRWAFVLGTIIATLLGSISYAHYNLVSIVLGLIVGLLIITKNETKNYLISIIALLVIGGSGLQAFYVSGNPDYLWIPVVLASFTIFMASMGAVVALKTILHKD